MKIKSWKKSGNKVSVTLKRVDALLMTEELFEVIKNSNMRQDITIIFELGNE